MRAERLTTEPPERTHPGPARTSDVLIEWPPRPLSAYSVKQERPDIGGILAPVHYGVFPIGWRIGDWLIVRDDMLTLTTAGLAAA